MLLFAPCCSDRFGRKGVFRASDANLPENAKQLLANQHFMDDEEKMSTKLRSVRWPQPPPLPPPPSPHGARTARCTSLHLPCRSWKRTI